MLEKQDGKFKTFIFGKFSHILDLIWDKVIFLQVDSSL